MVFAVKLIVVIRSRVLLSRQIFKFYTQFFLFEYFKFKEKNFHAIKIFETFFWYASSGNTESSISSEQENGKIFLFKAFGKTFSM